MTDLIPNATPEFFFTIGPLIECVRREIRQRRRVYERLVATRRLSQQEADYEIAAMSAVLEVLRTTPDGHKVAVRIKP